MKMEADARGQYDRTSLHRLQRTELLEELLELLEVSGLLLTVGTHC